MISNARYVHTNLVARDWRALADFYIRTFGCEPLPPERDYQGDLVDAVTGLQGIRVCGIHLKLPGFDKGGPTLEIFEYDSPAQHGPSPIHRPGFAHIAFLVDSVEDARREMIGNGGDALGELVTMTIANGAKVTLIYMKDPEGNIVELQSWEPPPATASQT
ncbi:MAG: VOC family protein [Verrucomicrobiae bacterium]|nr:VOC family protein [Verrucomicrobiae bacterium]